ncbi:MAG: glycosyltransferase [Marinilabiliaceae bacterium]|nr:glycosyltransferase [Marinilabiliaceae bacterium]
MLINRDIIITGIQSWNIAIGSNCKNIALELAKHNRVIYVNPPTDRLSHLRNPKATQQLKHLERDRKSNLFLQQINTNLWVFQPKIMLESISRLPFNALFDFLNRINNDRFAREIKKAIQHLHFTNYIHFCDSDMFRSLHLKELIKPKLSVYYTRDNLLAVKYWQQQGLRIEPQHMRKADLILANSTYLAQLAKRYNAHSFFVGQGCDTAAFEPHFAFQTPPELNDLPKPLIGYIGALKTLRLDVSVLEYLAKNRPEWSIVLVGPEDAEFQKSALHQYKNVHFIGRKEEHELPECLNALDVAINPQLINEVTQGNYPRKIDEYLAMGKPVVATKTEAMAYFADHVFLPQSHQEWASAIEQALNTNTPEEVSNRITFATEHTWSNNVREIGRQILLREHSINKAKGERSIPESHL